MLATMTTTTITNKKSNKVYMGLPEVLCLSAIPSSSVLLILVGTHDSVLSGSLILTPCLGTPSFFFFSVDFSWPTSIWWLSFYATVFYFLMLFFCYFLDTCSLIIIGRSRVDPNGRKGGRKNLEEEMEGELSSDYIVWEKNLCLRKRG